MLKPGDLVRFSYLWASQARAGEESGRKARPVCVVVRTTATPAALFLFPLTSQKPDASRSHIAVSEIECRRGGLDYPSFLILDEYNRIVADRAYDLEAPVPIGSFSAVFLRKIVVRIKQLAAERRPVACRAPESPQTNHQTCP